MGTNFFFYYLWSFQLERTRLLERDYPETTQLHNILKNIYVMDNGIDISYVPMIVTLCQSSSQLLVVISTHLTVDTVIHSNYISSTAGTITIPFLCIM